VVRNQVLLNLGGAVGSDLLLCRRFVQRNHVIHWGKFRGACVQGRSHKKLPSGHLGPGAAGIGLHSALIHGREQTVVAFNDNDQKLHGRKVRNVPAYSSENLE